MELILRVFGYELTFGRLVEETPNEHVIQGADLDIDPEAVGELDIEARTSRGFGFRSGYGLE